MNNQPVTRPQIIARLQENEIPFTEVNLQNGITLLVAQQGARAFGPFLSPEAESLYWINPDFADPEKARALFTENWNLGGDRLWVAPEIQYLVKDRFDYWNSVHVPREYDPANWTLEAAGPDECRLHNRTTLAAYTLASGAKQLTLDVRIQPAKDPLRHLSRYAELSEGVLYAGYETEVTIAESQRDAILSGTWNLVQLNPGGVLYVPCTPAVEVTDYKDPSDETCWTVHPHHVQLNITARRRYKVGIKAAHVFGRMGYLQQLEAGWAYLLVRSFPNHPSSEFPDEPPFVPGPHGDSIYVYNDDGASGDFGEMECNGMTIGGDTGRSASTDVFSLWLYVGAADQLNEIAAQLLGVRP